MPVLFRLTIGIKKGGRTYRMERVNHHGTSIYCIDGTPNGHHLSVHDATEHRPVGVIHSRLTKGEFKVLPGNVSVGRTITIGHTPPFAAITEPVAIGGESVSLIRIDERTLHFAKELSAGRQTESVILDVDALQNRFVGWFVLLLQPGDWLGAERWYRLRYKDFPGWRLESVHVWGKAEPWLAVGFVSAPIEN